MLKSGTEAHYRKHQIFNASMFFGFAGLEKIPVTDQGGKDAVYHELDLFPKMMTVVGAMPLAFSIHLMLFEELILFRHFILANLTMPFHIVQ